MKGQCGCACVILALSSKHLLGNSCVPGAVLGVGDLKVKMTRPYPHNSVEKGAFLQGDRWDGRAPDPNRVGKGFGTELPAGLRPGG